MWLGSLQDHQRSYRSAVFLESEVLRHASAQRQLLSCNLSKRHSSRVSLAANISHPFQTPRLSRFAPAKLPDMQRLRPLSTGVTQAMHVASIWRRRAVAKKACEHGKQRTEINKIEYTQKTYITTRNISHPTTSNAHRLQAPQRPHPE
jgi:hypothetical protein